MQEDVRRSGGDPPASQTENMEALKQALSDERARSERHLANWQRAEADLKNFQRRAEKEKTELADCTTSCVVLGLLPVIDDFEYAVASAPQETSGGQWASGVVMILKKLRDFLASQGVSPIEALGKGFDPKYHEAVMRGAGEEGKVLQELRKGYMLKETVLRPSLVVVGDGKSLEPQPGGAEEQRQNDEDTVKGGQEWLGR